MINQLKSKFKRVVITYTPTYWNPHKFDFMDIRITNLKVFGIHFHHSHSFQCYYATIDLFGVNVLIYITRPNYFLRRG